MQINVEKAPRIKANGTFSPCFYLQFDRLPSAIRQQIDIGQVTREARGDNAKAAEFRYD